MPNASTKVSRGYLLRKVPVALVRDFLIRFRNDRVDPLTDPVLVGRYIDERADVELKEWDVLLASVNDDDEGLRSIILGPPLGQAVRNVRSADLVNNILSISGASRRLGSPGDERVGVDPSKAAAALENFRRGQSAEGAPKMAPDRIYREVRDFPLLILRLIKIESKSEGAMLPDGPVVAWSISFPSSALNGGRVDYVVNTIKMRELFGVEDDEDEDVEFA